MAIVRYCRVQIIEGEESRLRDYYADRITTAGASRFSDGVKVGVMPIHCADLERVDPVGFANLMKNMSNLPEVQFEKVREGASNE